MPSPVYDYAKGYKQATNDNTDTAIIVDVYYQTLLEYNYDVDILFTPERLWGIAQLFNSENDYVRPDTFISVKSCCEKLMDMENDYDIGDFYREMMSIRPFLFNNDLFLHILLNIGLLNGDEPRVYGLL